MGGLPALPHPARTGRARFRSGSGYRDAFGAGSGSGRIAGLAALPPLKDFLRIAAASGPRLPGYRSAGRVFTSALIGRDGMCSFRAGGDGSSAQWFLDADYETNLEAEYLLNARGRSLRQTWRLCGYPRELSRHLASVNRPLTKPAHRHLRLGVRLVSIRFRRWKRALIGRC